MGLISFFKSLFDRDNKIEQIAAPMGIADPSDEYEKDLTGRAYYKRCLRDNRTEINRISRYVEQYTVKFDQVQKDFPKGSQEYESARDEMYRWKVKLDELKAQKKFFRPNTKEDIAYRNEIYTNFPEKLKEALSPNLDLRFHSTSISATRQIIQSRQITSTPDRYDGYIKNSDGIGEISVSSRNDIVRTIRHYSHLKDYSEALPAGCVFALFPKDKADAANHERSVMSSVDFRKNPEQLFGIFTTPENIERVKRWMKQVEIDPNIVYTHEEFLKVVRTRSAVEDRKADFQQSVVQTNINGEHTANWMNNANQFIVPDQDLYPGYNENECDDDYTQ